MKKLYFPIVLLTLFANFAFAQTYVTPTGAGAKNGSSWANAYDNTQLQQAINEAELAAVKQVWVAKGIYKPTEFLSTTVFLTDGITPTTNVDQDKAFVLKTGVAIYGGFAGTELSVNDRISISTTNETILSGDLNNSNSADAGDAYHIVAARNDADGAILDGFTIQHGFGDDFGYAEIEGAASVRRNIGAAIAFFSSKTLTFRNLLVKNNKTNNAGGAIYARSTSTDARIEFMNVIFDTNESTGIGGVIYYLADLGASQLNFTNCSFLNNKAGSTTGSGAVYFGGSSNDAILNINNSRFENNQAINGIPVPPATTTITYAGALRINTGVANISNTIFKDNKAGSDSDGRGGAIYSTSGAIVNADGCTFENNTSTGDGGHWTVFSGVSSVTNSIFTGGKSTTYGGAFYVASAGTLNIASSTFKGNTSTAAGGAIYQTGATSILNVKTSTFENNTSITTGGAINFYTGTATISNCMFKGNLATTHGGALYNFASTVDVQKAKFHSNTANSNGGAVYIYAGASIPSLTTISNSTFYNNYSKTVNTGAAGGGAIYQSRQTAGTTSTATVINSVFYANKSVNENPGYSFGTSPDIKTNLYNNIFYGNEGNTTTTPISADIRRSSGATTATQDYKNNLFQSSIAAGTNRTVANAYLLNTTTPEPLFASTNPADPNFLYPVNNSFAIDKGDNSLYAEVGDINTTSDLLGNPRLVNGGVAGNIDLGAIEYSSVLPVTISSFTAKLANNRTQLNWTVGTEDNVNRYEIERSQNGADFTKVAETKATLSSAYNVTDANPQIGLNYYRLKTVDNDGKFSYYGSLQTVKVNALAAASAKVYPNPVKGNVINVSLSGYPVGTYQAKLVSTAGVTVQENIINYDGAKDISFTSNVPAGIYILHLVNGDVKVQTKLIKQ